MRLFWRFEAANNELPHGKAIMGLLRADDGLIDGVGNEGQGNAANAHFR